MNLLRIAIKSARFRRTSLLLTVVSIAISVTLLLGVDVVRKEAKSSFLNTISQTDLIVGARSGPSNLLLYSVFHIGSAFNDVYDAVLGADVARDLGYQLGDEIVISHGLVSVDFAAHDDKPFTVVGILDKTGTPVDRAVLLGLAGIEAIHIDWQGGARAGVELDAEQALKFDLTPTSITAFMVGLDNPALTFRVQREINDYEREPLSAILPGATLSEFWRTISTIEQILFVLSIFVLVAGLLGMLTTILSTLNERRREIAVLRAIGARPSNVVMLIVLETLLTVVAGCLLGVGILYGMLALAQPALSRRFGVEISPSWLDPTQILIMATVIIGATLVSLIPGFVAYRRSIQDGLAVRI